MASRYTKACTAVVTGEACTCPPHSVVCRVWSGAPAARKVLESAPHREARGTRTSSSLCTTSSRAPPPHNFCGWGKRVFLGGISDCFCLVGDMPLLLLLYCCHRRAEARCSRQGPRPRATPGLSGLRYVALHVGHLSFFFLPNILCCGDLSLSVSIVTLLLSHKLG